MQTRSKASFLKEAQKRVIVNQGVRQYETDESTCDCKDGECQNPDNCNKEPKQAE